MSKANNSRTKTLAWNGVKLYIPNSWDSRFPKNQHIIFEKDFTPQLQLRWEKTKRINPNDLRKKLIDFSNTSCILEADTLPAAWSEVRGKFDLLLLAGKDNFTSGIFYYKKQKLIFLFEVLNNNSSALKDSVKSITSLSYSFQSDTLWQFQDFSFITPYRFTLENYSFAAGLTHLSFKQADLTCHICRLGPADQRLEQQSLESILETLVSAKAVLSCGQGNDNTYSLKREPSVWQQIKYRLRRQHPFILAEIYHDEQYNNLLAVVLSSRQPITIEPAHIFKKIE